MISLFQKRDCVVLQGVEVGGVGFEEDSFRH